MTPAPINLGELERLARASIADNDNPCIFAATQSLADFNEAVSPDVFLTLTARLRAAEGAWQPIETAPKDGTEILIYRHGWQEAPRARWGLQDGEDDDHKPTVFGGWFLASEWHTYGCEDGFLGWNEDIEDGVMPTHWSALPPPPDTTTSSGEGT